MLTVAGHYSISVRLGSSLADIQGSPFSVYIGPSGMNASMSAVWVLRGNRDLDAGLIARLAPMDQLRLQDRRQRSPFEVVAGMRIDVMIRTADSFGNERLEGGALVQARHFQLTEDMHDMQTLPRSWAPSSIISQQTALVTDRLNGTYAFTILPSEAAVYFLEVRFACCASALYQQSFTEALG
jgi:hypothetical protein